MSRFNFVRIKLSDYLRRMRGNLHVRFLKGKAAATAPNYLLFRVMTAG